MGRFATAWSAFWKILGSAEAAEAWQKAAAGQVDSGSETPAGLTKDEDAGTQRGQIPGDAVYTLALLQREGRLVDFLQEDIDAFSDAQIGAAVRKVHSGCRTVLETNFGIEPVHAEMEGASVTVGEGFDSRRIRVTGSPKGGAPFTGILRHRGWSVTKVDFPERNAKLDATLVCPAEVEV